MATLEERVQALEQENAAQKQEMAARKRAEELLTITVRALVSKEAFEKLQEQYGNLFDILNAHNVLTNERLGDIQSQIIELDGKVVGQQTEMRQHFAQIEATQQEYTTTTRQHFAQIEASQQEHTTTLTEQKNLLAEILARLPEKP